MTTSQNVILCNVRIKVLRDGQGYTASQFVLSHFFLGPLESARERAQQTRALKLGDEIETG